MSYKVSVEGEGATIGIEVFDYENPLAQHPDDASWLKAELTVQVGPFSGSFKTSVTTHDLAALCARTEQALQMLSGRVSFETTEGDLTLNMEFSKSGKVQIEGTAQPNGTLKTALQFRFQTDPSALDQMVRGLKVVTQRFPARQVQA